MPEDPFVVVKKPLLSWVYSHNRWHQGLLMVTAILAVGANLLPLEIQRRIVDEAIDQRAVDLLIRYCAIYLSAVLCASLLKYLISGLQNVIGENTVFAMRDQLYRHLLTLPLRFYRKTQPGLVVSALTTELATAGKFVGMAVAIPITNLLMLAGFGLYLFSLNPLLATLSFSIYPAALLLVPLLQRRVNAYNRMRVDTTRRMSGKAGESISGIQEIHANGTYTLEGDKFEKIIRRLRRTRIIWFLYRYAVKRVSSLLTNVSRFLVFAIGGYLAIRGQLQLGALVAFLSAQDKLYDPWKELITFYQNCQTALVTYNRTMAYFDSRPDHALIPKDREAYRLNGEIEVVDLACAIDDGVQLLSGIHLRLAAGEHLAIVGFSGSGKSTLVQCIGQLTPYTKGQIAIGGKEVSGLSKADMANSIGFVTQMPFIFEGSVEDNLLYAITPHTRTHTGGDTPAALSPGIDDKIMVLQQTGLFSDVLRFGLESVLDPGSDPQIADAILEIRRAFQEKHRDAFTEIIEFYDPNRYMECASIAENLVFGDIPDPSLQVAELPENRTFVEFLRANDLLTPLLRFSAGLMEEMVQRYDEAEFDGARFDEEHLPADTIDGYKRLLNAVRQKPNRKMPPEMQAHLLAMGLKFVAHTDDSGRMPQALRDRIVALRKPLRDKLCAASPDGPASCDLTGYLSSQSILTNILFGKVKDNRSAAQREINKVTTQLLIETDFLEDIVKMGLAHQVGSKGVNLSGGQQQKLAIARALIKAPPVLILDEATSGLDNDSQERIQKLLFRQWRGSHTLLAVVHRLDTLGYYDKIAVMKGGRIVETGTRSELMRRGGVLSDLINASAG
jgi:ABC-type multidrug transport system fused ATPase/permease subunit